MLIFMRDCKKHLDPIAKLDSLKHVRNAHSKSASKILQIIKGTEQYVNKLIDCDYSAITTQPCIHLTDHSMSYIAQRVYNYVKFTGLAYKTGVTNE